MTDKENNSGNIPDQENHEIFSDEKTAEKIHEHLSNKNDQITEQDISSAKTGVDELTGDTVPDTSASESNRGDQRKDDNEESEGRGKSGPVSSPWEILGS